MSFEIKLPLFEGPFDLLLFFIERDELDIYDIPISRITDDFLAYLRQMEELNLEVASEFVLVAATLMRIKAKMLLPRPTLDEEGNEIDPRDELVRHLLEYKKYKSVVGELGRLEDEQAQREKRGNVAEENKQLAEAIEPEAELHKLDLYQLMRVFQKVMQRYAQQQERPVHQVVPYPYTISSQKNFLLDRLNRQPLLSFADLVADKPEKILVIFNFLAILELLQLGEIRLQLGEGFNNFWVSKVEVSENV